MRDEGNKEEEIRTVTFFSPLLKRENETRAFRETHLTRELERTKTTIDRPKKTLLEE